MSRISQLVSALAGDAYEDAQRIYKEIETVGTLREQQDAKYIMSVM